MTTLTPIFFETSNRKRFHNYFLWWKKKRTKKACKKVIKVMIYFNNLVTGTVSCYQHNLLLACIFSMFNMTWSSAELWMQQVWPRYAHGPERKIGLDYSKKFQRGVTLYQEKCEYQQVNNLMCTSILFRIDRVSIQILDVHLQNLASICWKLHVAKVHDIHCQHAQTSNTPMSPL